MGSDYSKYFREQPERDAVDAYKTDLFDLIPHIGADVTIQYRPGGEWLKGTLRELPGMPIDGITTTIESPSDSGQYVDTSITQADFAGGMTVRIQTQPPHP